MEQVNITYCGHACFLLEADGYRIVLDPYRDGMVPGLPDLNLKAEAVYCSHGHDDHGFVQAVTILDTDKSMPYTLDEFVTPHDDQGGKLRGMNTVRIFNFDGLRISHLGDIGCYPEDDLLNKLKHVDCLMIPVGGFYTIDAATAKNIVDAVQPRVTIPMHYRTDNSGFDRIAHISDFTQYYPRVKSCDNTVTLTQNTENQILVINYKPQGD